MPTALYETQLVCDNCGAVVTRRRVDESHFEKLVEEADPALPGVDPSGGVMDDGDLTSVDVGRPVEVLLEHVAVCGRCSGSP
jgi:hypothetical protein